MKKYHKNKKLNKVLIKIEENSKKEKHCFSKKQKKRFIKNIYNQGYTFIEFLVTLTIIGFFSYLLYIKGFK